MSAHSIRILPTDTRWPGPWHVEEGPDGLCSRCGLALLEPEIAIRAGPEDDPNRSSSRYHPACLGCTTDEPLEDDDTPQPCGHPWTAVVWREDETGDCRACLAAERRARGEEEPPDAHEGP